MTSLTCTQIPERARLLAGRRSAWCAALFRGGLFLLVVHHALAMAQVDERWRLIGQTPSMRLHYDPSSVVRNEDIRRLREIQDMDSPDPDGVRSRVYTNEYDCKNQMHRLGQMQSYAGAMLTGARLFDVKEMGYWRRIPAGSVFAQMYARVCPGAQILPATEPPTPLQRLFSPN
jgi:hypothetical protein